MALPTLDENAAPLETRGELLYSQGKAQAHKLTAQYAPVFASLLDECTVITGKDLAHRDAIVLARCLVDGCDDELDSFVIAVANALLLLNGNNRDSAEFRQYFGSKQPHEVRRPILGEELETVRGWIGPLKASAHQVLRDLGAQAETLVSDADKAVAALAKAEQDYRVFCLTGERSQFTAKCNATRKTVYGELAKIPHTPEGKHLPGDFADRFFMHDRGKNKKPTVDMIRKQVSALEEKLAKQKAQLEELEAEEAQKREADIEREAIRAQLAEAEKLRLEAERKTAELRAKLKK